MTETHFLGLGITHYPLLAGKDKDMAGVLYYTLRDPDIPAVEKDPASWPSYMQKEWGEDRGVSAAAGHRQALVSGLAKCREALDDFGPDVVLVWGDDQYENFREEVVPPFCILAYPDLEVEAFEIINDRDQDNIWDLPRDTEITIRGVPELAKSLADALIRRGVDMAYSYRKRSGAHFPHAILNTQLFLDYENAGRKFPYPLLPMTVNCYSAHAISRKGGMARFADIANEELDPIGPTPQRCYEVGAQVARALRGTGKRVALVASSSWSHAFLDEELWHIRPDTESDIELYEALRSGDIDAWLKTTPDDIIRRGQHEMLNWFCLMGAMNELGMELQWSDLVTTGVFNSNKCFAIYQE